MRSSFTGICLLLFVSCQVERTVKTHTEVYADGKIKSIHKTVVRKNRDFELHGNFRKETRIVRNYFDNGKLSLYWKTVYTSGSDVPCYESFYKMEQYDSNGTKRELLELKCDCQKRKEISYNAKGKKTKVEKRVIKRIE